MKYLNVSLKILLITNGMILLAGAMMGPIYAFFVSDIGGNILDAGIAGGLFALVAGIVTMISGKYVDKIKEGELIIVLGYLIIALGFYLYSRIDSVFDLFLIQILIGLGEAVYSPAFDSVYTKHMKKKHSGRVWGLWEGVNYFSIAMGSFIGGVIVSQFGFNILFYIMTGLPLFSAIYIFLLPRKIL